MGSLLGFTVKLRFAHLAPLLFSFVYTKHINRTETPELLRNTGFKLIKHLVVLVVLVIVVVFIFAFASTPSFVSVSASLVDGSEYSNSAILVNEQAVKSLQRSVTFAQNT